MREPSCELNHEMLRREIRDNGMPSHNCPLCGWKLSAAKEELVAYKFTNEDKVMRIYTGSVTFEFEVQEDEDPKKEFFYLLQRIKAFGKIKTAEQKGFIKEVVTKSVKI